MLRSAESDTLDTSLIAIGSCTFMSLTPGAMCRRIGFFGRCVAAVFNSLLCVEILGTARGEL